VVNFNSNNVTAINGATNATTTIAVGTGPDSVAIDSATDMIYVTNFQSGNVTVINGANHTVAATVSTGSGSGPEAIAVNSVTNMIYTANGGNNTVSAINGATYVTATINLPSTPFSIAVNPVTNMIYAPNLNTNSITAINGATNAITANISVGALAFGVAVNPVTNTIYAMNCGSGCTNTPDLPTTITVINGATNATETLTPSAVQIRSAAVNPVTNTVYVPDGSSGRMIEITEQQVQDAPLFTLIDALPNNETPSANPLFTVQAESSFYPTAPMPQAVWYQFDTWQGPWSQALGTGPNFFIFSPVLTPGTHVLYAFATDGQDANSTGVAQQFIGGIAAYVFTIITPPVPVTVNPHPGCAGHLCRL